MPRRPLTLAAVASLFALCAMLAAWGVSYRYALQLEWRGRTSVYIDIELGKLKFVVTRTRWFHTAWGRGLSYEAEKLDPETAWLDEPDTWAGFRWDYDRDADGFGADLFIPCWFGLIACGALPLAYVLRRQKHGSACPTCGYDLRATPARCPECGAAPAARAGGAAAR